MTTVTPQQAPTPAPLGSPLEIADFVDLPGSRRSHDPLRWPGYGAQLDSARTRTGLEQAVLAGHAAIGGQRCILAAFQFEFLGGSLGQAEGDRLIDAIEAARSSGLPLVSIGRSGGARMQEGTVSLFQMTRIARSLNELASAGIPHIAVAGNPTTGGVWASLTAAADVVIGLSGAQVAFAGARVRRAGGDHQTVTAETQQESGFVDLVADGDDLTATVAGYLRMLSPLTRGTGFDPPLPELTPDQDHTDTSGWASVHAARSHTRRPATDYLQQYLTERLPISGDRAGGTDNRILCGFGRRDHHTVAYVCQRGDAVGPAGFRTASRLISLADQLSIPVVTFIDTAGADNTVDAERSGIGPSIAILLRRIAECTVPVLSVVVGQGVSGGAIALVNPDNMWMAPDSYLAVIAPESAAAILKQHPDTAAALSEQLALSPTALYDLKLARGILTPPDQPNITKNATSATPTR